MIVGQQAMQIYPLASCLVGALICDLIDTSTCHPHYLTHPPIQPATGSCDKEFYPGTKLATYYEFSGVLGYQE